MGRAAIWLALLCCVVGCYAPATPAAPDAPPACRLASDCPIGMSCMGGACALECRDDRDCAASSRDTVCDVRVGRCVPRVVDAGPPADERAVAPEDRPAPVDDLVAPPPAPEGGGGADPLPGEGAVGDGPGDSWRPEREVSLPCPWLSQVPPSDWAHAHHCGPTSLIMGVACMTSTRPTAVDITELSQWMVGNVSGYTRGPPVGQNTTLAQLAEASLEYYGRATTTATTATLRDLYDELAQGRPVVVGVETQGSNNAPNDVMGRGEGHFMLVVGLGATHVVVNDPGRSQPANADHRRYTIASFLTVWGRHGRSMLRFSTATSGCVNECSAAGQRECVGATGARACGNHDSDACLEWGPTGPCPSGQACAAGACSATCMAGAACDTGNPCEAGAVTCAGAAPTCERRGFAPPGTSCGAGLRCDGAGGCGCPSAQTRCGGACVDTTSSAAHCGGCDRPCAAGQACSGGHCVSTCGAAGQRCCDGSCNAGLYCIANLCQPDATPGLPVYRFGNQCNSSHWHSTTSCYPSAAMPTAGCPSTCMTRVTNPSCGTATCWARESSFNTAASNPGYGSFFQVNHCFMAGGNFYSRTACAAGAVGDPATLGWMAAAAAGPYARPVYRCQWLASMVAEQFLTTSEAECRAVGTIVDGGPFGYAN